MAPTALGSSPSLLPDAQGPDYLTLSHLHDCAPISPHPGQLNMSKADGSNTRKAQSVQEGGVENTFPNPRECSEVTGSPCLPVG